MAARSPRVHPVPVSDLVARVMDPLLARRAGLTTNLMQSWDEIVGERLGASTRPERIRWGRRKNEDEAFEPATLVIACDSAAALRVQHMTGEILARVNGFFGYAAIGRIRIVQRPVTQPGTVPARRELAGPERQRIADRVAAIEDEDLRKALARLGENVVLSRERRGNGSGT